MAVDKAAEREEKLRALQDKLTVGVEQLVTGEDWKRAIEFAARFRSRSFSNTILIALAHAEAFEKGLVPNPYPTYVAGYRQWQQPADRFAAGCRAIRSWRRCWRRSRRATRPTRPPGTGCHEARRPGPPR